MATQRRRTSERRRSPISHCTKPPCPWPTRPEDRRTAPGAAAAGGIGVRPRRNGSLPYTQRPGIGSEREFDEPNARPDLPLTAAAPSAGCSLDMLAIPIAPEGRPAVWNAGGCGEGDASTALGKCGERQPASCAERVPNVCRLRGVHPRCTAQARVASVATLRLWDCFRRGAFGWMVEPITGGATGPDRNDIDSPRGTWRSPTRS